MMLTSNRDLKLDVQAFMFNALAFLLWGMASYYFGLAPGVSAGTILVNRILASFVFGFVLVLVSRQSQEFLLLLRQPRSLAVLILTTFLIASNWLAVIYAVQMGQLSQASVGYFLAPIILMATGRFFLKEEAGPHAMLPLVPMLLGTAFICMGTKAFPWLGLMVAVSFTLYSLLRKKLRVSPLVGMTMESGFAALVALIFLMKDFAVHTAPYRESLSLGLWLAGTGIVTTLPMVFYSLSLPRLPLKTVGMLQYLTPTLMFLIAVFLFHEAINPLKASGFILIWLGIALSLLPLPIFFKKELKNE
jgi:chloramphenicol-sensitive protein RarD